MNNVSSNRNAESAFGLGTKADAPIVETGG